MGRKETHVAPAKREAVRRISELVQRHKVVGVASVSGVPGPQLQAIRQKLRGKVEILVSKNNLIRIAINENDQSRQGLKGLSDGVRAQTALVATDLNPFLLYKEMERTKQRSPARGGETAPEDISVSEGETPFKPGPIVGELQKAGIPAGIEGGKVVIKKDKLLVRKGERIPRELAPMLAKLEILPMTVGLDLQMVWEAGTIYPAGVLAIDETRIMAEIAKGAAQALELALRTAYPTGATIQPLLQKARREALGLAIEAGVATRETIELLLGRAHGQAAAVSSQLKM
ncbi:MAG: 50S ribosomal protein L10 [Thermoplasmatota archaeon]